MTASTIRPPISRAAVCLLCALLALLVWAGRADASVGEEIVLRCTHGESLKGFTQKDYSEALHVVANEAELEEYSPCGQLIHQAELEALGIPVGGGAGAAGSAGTPGGTPGVGPGSSVVRPPREPSRTRARSNAPSPSLRRHRTSTASWSTPGCCTTTSASAASALPTSPFRSPWASLSRAGSWLLRWRSAAASVAATAAEARGAKLSSQTLTTRELPRSSPGGSVWHALASPTVLRSQIWSGLLVAAVLCLVTFVAGAGISVRDPTPATTIEMVLTIGSGVAIAASVLLAPAIGRLLRSVGAHRHARPDDAHGPLDRVLDQIDIPNLFNMRFRIH